MLSRADTDATAAPPTPVITSPVASPDEAAGDPAWIPATSAPGGAVLFRTCTPRNPPLLDGDGVDGVLRICAATVIAVLIGMANASTAPFCCHWRPPLAAVSMPIT